MTRISEIFKRTKEAELSPGYGKLNPEKEFRCNNCRTIKGKSNIAGVDEKNKPICLDCTQDKSNTTQPGPFTQPAPITYGRPWGMELPAVPQKFRKTLDFGVEKPDRPVTHKEYDPSITVKTDPLESYDMPGCECKHVLAEAGIEVPQEVKDKIISFLPGTQGLGKSFKGILPDTTTRRDDPEDPRSKKREVLERPEEGRGTVYHKFIFDSINNLLKKGDADTIKKIVPPTGDSSKDATEVLNHLFSHGERAGLNPADMGVSDEIYHAFRSTKDIARAQEPKEVTEETPPISKRRYDIPTNDCGVCEQHWKAYKDGVEKYKNKTSSLIPGATPEETASRASETSSELSSKIFNDWSMGNKPDRKSQPELAGLYSTLNNWNAHQRSHHNVSITGADPRIPVRVDTSSAAGERDYDVESVYKELKRMSGGWDYEKNIHIPEDPLFSEKDINAPRFEPFDERTETTGEYAQRSQGEYEQIKREIKGIPAEPSGYKPYEPRKIPRGINEQTGKPYGEADTVAWVPEYDAKGNTKPRVERGLEREYKRDEAGKLQPTGNWVPGENHVTDSTALVRKRIQDAKQRVKVDLDKATAIGRPEQGETAKYTIEPNPRAVQNYSMERDPRAGKYEDVIRADRPEIVKNIPGLDIVPRQHAYLFQKAGIEPDVAAIREHHRQQARYENQPTHKTVTVGEEERTVGGPTTTYKEVKRGVTQDGLDYDEEHKRLFGGTNESGEYEKGVHQLEAEKLYPSDKMKTGPLAAMNYVSKIEKEWHKQHSKRVTMFDTTDEWGYNKPGSNAMEPKIYVTTTVPVVTNRGPKRKIKVPITKAIEIPEEDRIKEPTFIRELAERNYSKSYNEALSKAYPEAKSPEEAQAALAKEHGEVVKRMDKVKAESTIPSNRRTIMSKKEFEMSQFIFNSSKKEAMDAASLAHGVVHAVDWIANQGKATWDSMQHPERAVDKFNKVWQHAYDTGTLGENGNPEYYSTAPMSEEAHAAMGYGAGALATGLGVAKGISSLRNKLNQRRDIKGEHDRRKGVWDKLDQGSRDFMTGTYGRQVNPYNPGHDPSSNYGHVSQNKRTSSKINDLSARLFSN